MRHLYVCNTTDDKIDSVDMDRFVINKSIKLPGVNFSRVGPHGVCIQGECLYTSNCYDGSISVVNLVDGNVESYYIGRYCRDICALGNHLYVVCGDSNSTAVFDIVTKEIIEIIPVGDSPHSIDCCAGSNKIVVANNGDNSINIFDSLYGNSIADMKVGESPNKALFTCSGDSILVCESAAETAEMGCISVISSSSYKILHRISVGNCPFDMFCDQYRCYVSNYGDGTVSVIDLKTFSVIKIIHIGGMPRGIVCDGRYIYVGDSYNNRLIKVNINNENDKKIIPMTGQPTGMIMD